MSDSECAIPLKSMEVRVVVCVLFFLCHWISIIFFLFILFILFIYLLYLIFLQQNHNSLTGPEYGTFIGRSTDEEVSDFHSQSALWRNNGNNISFQSSYSNQSNNSQPNNHNNNRNNNNYNNHNYTNNTHNNRSGNDYSENMGGGHHMNGQSSANLNNSLHLRTPSITDGNGGTSTRYLNNKNVKTTTVYSASQSSIDFSFNKRFNKMAKNFLRKHRSDSIRTDKHTGSRYRQMKSISTIVNNNEHPLDYEKEVFTSAVE